MLLLAALGWITSRRAVFQGPRVDRKVLADARRRYYTSIESVDERTPLIGGVE